MRLIYPRITIFADYSQVSIGTEAEINTIKKITNITANYFYNVINVTRIPRLFYPLMYLQNAIILKQIRNMFHQELLAIWELLLETKQIYKHHTSPNPCHALSTFRQSINLGQGDLEQCFFKIRSGWISGNAICINNYQIIIQNHQFFHLLGFSTSMYEAFPAENPLVMGEQGEYYINSPKIQEVIRQFFGWNNSKGLPLLDHDETLIASHWERKIVGNQFMIATGKLGAYFSNFSLALLSSTGWYSFVNNTYAQPTTWGQGKGCDFLSIDSCQGAQFCQDKQFKCNWQTTAIAKCNNENLLGSCQTHKYFSNTICVDENYQTKNLNGKLNDLQRGGSSSRCFNSDFRQEDLNKLKLNYRCYITFCSATSQNIYIMVGSYMLICRKPGQIHSPPVVLTGSLTCPKKFNKICKNKKTCQYNCNKNGVCVDRRCLCTGSTTLTSSFIDISRLISPVGLTGGLLNSLSDSNNTLQLNGSTTTSNNNNNRGGLELKVKQIKQYLLNSNAFREQYRIKYLDSASSVKISSAARNVMMKGVYSVIMVDCPCP